MVRDETRDSLSADDRKLLQEAATEAAKYQREVSRNAVAGALENMKKQGIQVTEFPPAEIAKFVEKMKPVYAKHGAALGETVTELIAHIGWPTRTFRAPMIYNPYFQSAGIDAVVVPMGCRAEHFTDVLRAVFALENTRGALITMPHKVSVVALCDDMLFEMIPAYLEFFGLPTTTAQRLRELAQFPDDARA